MRFGVREICDVVLKAKTAMKVGNRVFYKNEPVCYFDSLKTSSLETQSNAVYAQGGRGNARLISWEGERTVTFTMEDALISPISFSILSGAGVIEAGASTPIYMHTTEQTDKIQLNDATNPTTVTIQLSQRPFVRGDFSITTTPGENNTSTTTAGYGTNGPSSNEDFIYVMVLDENGEVVSEPYIASETTINNVSGGGATIVIKAEDSADSISSSFGHTRQNNLKPFTEHSTVLVDYYVEKTSNAKQVNISPASFGGNFYLEASTLFRTTQGVDVPAEFIIPNCKIQSNFTFTMAATGDPSTFTFTMDAFPDYTRWDRTKKVFAAIQFEDDLASIDNFKRFGTEHDYAKGTIGETANTNLYNAIQKETLENPKREKI